MRVLLIVATLAAAACSPAGNDQSGRSGTDAPAAAADAQGGERFYGKERFTIVSKLTGRESGDLVEHVRDWGRTRAEIKKSKLEAGPVTVPTDNRVVYRGAEATTIDSTSGAVTQMTNPLYTDIVDAMRGRTGVEFGKEMMTRMGGRPTGERGAFAGQDCDYWEIAQTATRSCVTPWGATLHLKSNFGGIAIERTATEVRLDDGGPDAAFAFDASRASQSPDVEDALEKLKGL